MNMMSKLSSDAWLTSIASEPLSAITTSRYPSRIVKNLQIIVSVMRLSSTTNILGPRVAENSRLGGLSSGVAPSGDWIVSVIIFGHDVV